MSHRVLLLLLALVVVVTGAALAVGLRSGASAGGNCNGVANAAAYQVIIQNGKTASTKISGHLCDTLTFINKDNTAREIAFGPHEDHVPYDGVAERVLTKNESFTVTFDKIGSYRWHDHLHDEIEGTFTVAK